MTDDQKAAAYYKAGLLKEAPLFVPAKVRVLREQFGDFPVRGAGVPAGEHECQCNKWGAVSVISRDGKPLGLRLDEFEPVAWRENGTPTDCIHRTNPLSANQRDAKRYRWLRDRLMGADFDWNESGAQVLAFEMPKGSQISASCDTTIDEAMSMTPNDRGVGPDAASCGRSHTTDGLCLGDQLEMTCET